MTAYLLGRPVWGDPGYGLASCPARSSLPLPIFLHSRRGSHHQRRESGETHIPVPLECHRDQNLRSPSGNNRSGLREKSAVKWIRNPLERIFGLWPNRTKQEDRQEEDHLLP